MVRADRPVENERREKTDRGKKDDERAAARAERR